MQMKLHNKKVTVVGLGLTGQACVQFALAQGATVYAMDTREHLDVSALREQDASIALGQFAQAQQDKLLASDLILISPGISLHTPAIAQAMAAGIEVIGDIELFARYNNKPVAAITGSNGKSTVTELLANMLTASNFKVGVGGNFGTPVLSMLDDDVDMFVLELSSFQLETVSSLSPKVASILNLSPDHLDRHGSIQAYHAAKQRIYLGAEHCVANRDDDLTMPEDQKVDCWFGLSVSGHDFSWDAEQQEILLDGHPYLNMRDCQLFGLHNVLNIQAAAAMARLMGSSEEGIKQAAISYSGLEHRCQKVTEINSVAWINDSKATNVGATLAAIEGLADQASGKLILIAGGEGKGADFSPLQTSFKQHLKALITIGKDGAQLAELFQPSYLAASLPKAVTQAAALASQGDTVLLSPACASLDMFKDYQARGECFVKAVQELAA